MNGHNPPRANRKAAELAARRRLGATGGSDVHELSDLGRAFTEFPVETADVPSALRALVEGTTTGGGSSLSLSARVRNDWRTMVLRLRRGLRPI